MKKRMKAKYLGGHPAHKRATVCTLTIDDDGVRAKIVRPFIDVPWASVTQLSVDGPEGSRRVTATRLLATGIFAFAFKKKRKRVAYVTVRTPEGDAIFEVQGVEPIKLRAALAWTAPKVAAT